MKRFLVALLAATSLLSFPAKAAPPPLSTYGQLPGFETASISTTGEHVALVGMVEGARRIVIIDANGKAVKAIPVSNMKILRLDWAGDEYLLVRYSETVSLGLEFTTEKAELSSVVVVPLGNEKLWTMFAEQGDIVGGVRGSYGITRRNGHWYGYFGGVTLARSTTGYNYLPNGKVRPDLYEVDLHTKKPRKLAPRPDGDDVDRDWLVDGNGAIAASIDVSRRSGNWAIYNGRREKLASGTEPTGLVDLVGFTADGSGVVYAIRDSKGNTDGWFNVPLAGGVPQPFLPDETFERIFTDGGHRLTGYIDDSAERLGHFFDPRRNKIYRASQKAFPGRRMDLESSNEAFDRLLVTTQGPDDPITWWKVDIKTGRADVLGTAYAIAQTMVGPMRMLPYSASDGLKMEGVLTLPPGREAKLLPAVILPHGGPASHDIAGFDWIAQAFASRGYAVFQPNFRGSTGYGTAFEVAGHGEWGKKMQSDISDGLAELVKQGIVDPKRVCIVGASYGGYAALAGVTLQQGVYRCAVSYAGLSDLNAFINDESQASDRDPMLMRNLKAEVGSGRDLKLVSPVRFAERVNVPVLLIHGKDDTVVNFSQSTAMAEAMRRAGKPVQLVTLPHEDHWLSSSETRLTMLQSTVEFVLKNNPPDPGG